MNKYFLVKEVAALFSRRPETIRRWIHEGRLQALRIKGGYLILGTEIERLQQKGGEK